MTTRYSQGAASVSRLSVLLTVLALSACGGGGGGSQTGQISIAVTDAPIDQGITKVSVQFAGLELKPESGPPIVFDFGVGNELNIDLLQLQGEGSSYLILDEDSEGDTTSPIGFDDDALVIELVAKAVGREDVLEAPKFKQLKRTMSGVKPGSVMDWS